MTLFSSFLGPVATLTLFLLLVFLFSINRGFAGIAYTDLIGKTIPSTDRGQLYAWRQIVGGAAGLFVGAFGFWAIREPETASTVATEKPKAFLQGVAGILKEDRRFLLFVILENITALSLMVLPFYMVFLKRTFPEATAWVWD